MSPDTLALCNVAFKFYLRDGWRLSVSTKIELKRNLASFTSEFILIWDRVRYILRPYDYKRLYKGTRNSNYHEPSYRTSTRDNIYNQQERKIHFINKSVYFKNMFQPPCLLYRTAENDFHWYHLSNKWYWILCNCWQRRFVYSFASAFLFRRNISILSSCVVYNGWFRRNLRRRRGTRRHFGRYICYIGSRSRRY